MAVNTFSLAAVGLMGFVGAAVAAPLPATVDSNAFIYGHNVYSRFLPGSYIIDPGATDGGPAAQAGSTTQSVAEVAAPVRTDPVTEPLIQTSTSSVPTFPSLLDSAPSASQGGNTSTVLDGTDGSTAGSLTGVGAVPLPPALPLFGAAVLGLTMVGMVRGRRAAKL